ncbi:hypothetical protein [Streptomyces rapamycinicus]|uniref:Cupin superfamily protein n=1 Tax=Streptomyces rapamycinicus TaxID=1226757 RepID=A0ABR6LXZ8_9ACTN|nr:hypothetical protein [Streptomyces rapamycinicus]MBB4786916.1 putative cupin superfamily protein [Streptomyces rapamycinicus]UTO66936.1 hypothetical protein LJB45_34545 [Streptomyces rapamycinicus]UTP34892.1 hypothetical protein LIV37_39675 [Streptomyces rapamycinicus NRRL 5491]
MLGEVETGISKFEIAEIESTDPNGYGTGFIWGFDEPPTLPYYPDEPYKVRSVLAPPGGVRVFGAHFPPLSRLAEMEWSPGSEEQRKLINAQPSGIHWYDGVGFGCFHSHDSIAIDTVVSGTIAVEVSDGTREVLNSGDVVVFCGSNHRWQVISDEPCTVLVTEFHATRRQGEEPSGTMEDVRMRIAALANESEVGQEL